MADQANTSSITGTAHRPWGIRFRWEIYFDDDSFSAVWVCLHLYQDRGLDYRTINIITEMYLSMTILQNVIEIEQNHLEQWFTDTESDIDWDTWWGDSE